MCFSATTMHHGFAAAAQFVAVCPLKVACIAKRCHQNLSRRRLRTRQKVEKTSRKRPAAVPAPRTRSTHSHSEGNFSSCAQLHRASQCSVAHMRIVQYTNRFHFCIARRDLHAAHCQPNILVQWPHRWRGGCTPSRGHALVITGSEGGCHWTGGSESFPRDA